MKPARSLPPGYGQAFALDLSSDRRVMVLLNIAGLALLVPFGAFFWWTAQLLRPGIELRLFELSSLAGIVSLILAMVLMILLHEAVHGLFFWIYLQDRPIFGLRAAYAFAAAPDWFIPRNPYLVIGLAPLILISAAGLVLFLIIPERWFLPVFALLALNAAGAVGDLFVFLRLISQPAETLICDEGDRFTAYLPAGSLSE